MRLCASGMLWLRRLFLPDWLALLEKRRNALSEVRRFASLGVGFERRFDRRIEPGLVLRSQQALGRCNRLWAVRDQSLRKREDPALQISGCNYLVHEPEPIRLGGVENSAG